MLLEAFTLPWSLTRLFTVCHVSIDCLDFVLNLEQIITHRVCRSAFSALSSCTAAAQDSFRSFQGADRYQRFSWIADNVSEPRAVRLLPLTQGRATLCHIMLHRTFPPEHCGQRCKVSKRSGDATSKKFKQCICPVVCHNHRARRCGDAQVVTRMRLEDRCRGLISWRLRGKLGLLPIDVDFESEYKLNMLTGRVEEHRCAALHCCRAA